MKYMKKSKNLEKIKNLRKITTENGKNTAKICQIQELQILTKTEDLTINF